MTRLVVYVGAQRTGSEGIHRALFVNEPELARQGVLVPVTGRHDLSATAVRHHHLPWSLDPDDDRVRDDRVWEALAEEIDDSSASTAVLASGLFAQLAADPARSAEVVRRLRGVSDDVTLVMFVRDQLALLNSLFCRQVRELALSCGFDSYLQESPDAGLYDFAATFRPWYEDESIRFVSVPWDRDGGSDALSTLLTAGEISFDDRTLSKVADTPDEIVGPIAVEALRLLTADLRGRFPDFDPNEPAAIRLRRRAATAVRAKGWCKNEFWGWGPGQAAEALARYTGSNQEFARRTGNAGWTLPAPHARAQNVAELVELSPGAVNRVHRFVTDMETAYIRLRARQVAA